jgi:predicted ATP-grasp superfamily ATP-dependent carboligase
LSARPFVEAAVRAGYTVTAIDAFADAETAALAKKSIALAYDRLGFDADALMAAINDLDLSHFDGFVYGSGFEAQPELLDKVAAKLPLIGNAAATVAALKTPARFFAALQQLNINYPDVTDSLPQDHANDFLLKFAGGSGGTHISAAKSQNVLLESKYYYQKKIDGLSVSLLFLANKHDVEIVGFNEQWVSPTVDAPYRYGGAVSHVMLPDHIKTLLSDAAKKLTSKFGLLGLNSLDAIVDAENSQISVLEINPRLSATVALYNAEQQNLLERHIKACSGNHDLNQKAVHKLDLKCKAHAIVYAAEDIELSAAILWPDWVADKPLLNQKAMKISATEPICTVLAYADSAATAKKLAQSRVEIVENLLQSLNS